ncbi:unnamed protein product [marine sediment metagenome]|uniref:Uncharacterized protein n=1 Tax=marine sediment metagenome TaxID=412755 RepID=X1PM42_9ZZZZ
MKITTELPDKVLIEFTDIELDFMREEAQASSVSIEEMLHNLFGAFFIGGYKFITGK